MSWSTRQILPPSLLYWPLLIRIESVLKIKGARIKETEGTKKPWREWHHLDITDNGLRISNRWLKRIFRKKRHQRSHKCWSFLLSCLKEKIETEYIFSQHLHRRKKSTLEPLFELKCQLSVGEQSSSNLSKRSKCTVAWTNGPTD